MSVYKGAKSPFYQYDFQIDSRRFLGSTKARSKKDAELIEKKIKAQAIEDLERERITGNGPMTFDIAAGRYFTEKGEHHRNATDTHYNLEMLVTFFGKTKRLEEISDGDVAALVAWRRKQTAHGRKKTKDGPPVKLIAPATVNRTVLVPLKAIFSRAKRTWKYPLPLEPDWRAHWLPMPEERVRELDDAEAAALDAHVRDDYALWFEFARLTGLRRNETLIRWKEISINQITTIGKRGKKVVTPITLAIRAILDECRGHHPEYVFTYICRQPKGEQVRGKRYPITPQGAKTQWRRLKARSGVADFRFHDIRHDVATKLLRKTGNLKMVQKALNHSNIATTARYAHVHDDELAEAMQSLAESRKKSRNKDEKVA